MVTPIKKILIGINMTDISRRAFYTGLDLASRFGAETFVLHVSEPIRSYDFGKARYVETSEIIERVEAGVKRRVDELWESRGIDAVDRRKIHVVVRGGRAAEEIVASAAAKGVDLIVIGQGAQSTAETVVRGAPCSVLTVRPSE